MWWRAMQEQRTLKAASLGMSFTAPSSWTLLSGGSTAPGAVKPSSWLVTWWQPEHDAQLTRVLATHLHQLA